MTGKWFVSVTSVTRWLDYVLHYEQLKTAQKRKYCQNRFKILPNTQKLALILFKVAKFNQIWSHWSIGVQKRCTD